LDNEQLISGLLRQLINIKDKKQLEEQQKEIRRQKFRNRIRTAFLIIAVLIFIIVCTFSIYKRYASAITTVYDMPAPIDPTQQEIPDNLNIDPNQQDFSVDPNQQDIPQETLPPAENPQENATSADSQPQETSPQGDGHFTIYSNGDVYHAQNGKGNLTCDVRNVADSTHDIIMSIYLTREEMQAHGISTEGMEESADKWLIAETGLFEPNHQISSVPLKALPDGSYLKAGSYKIIMNERFYHHETHERSSYETNIQMTLEVAE